MDKQQKQIDKNIFNEQSLSTLNIKELRNMARNLGVIAPTLMKKSDLISNILDTVYGKVNNANFKNSGRPSTQEVDLDKCIQKIKDKNDSKEKILNCKIDDDFNFGEFKVASPKEDFEVYDESELVTRVFVRENGKCYLKKYGFISSDDDIEISNELAKNLKLENLDVLEVAYVGNLHKIVSVNGIRLNEKIEGLCVCGENLKGGQKKFFYVSTKEKIKREIEKIVEFCNDSKIKLYVFSENSYGGENVTNGVYDDQAVGSKFYKNFYSFLELCGGSVSKNENFILVIDDISKVENYLDEFDEDISSRAKTHIENMFTKFAKLGNLIVAFRLAKSNAF